MDVYLGRRARVGANRRRKLALRPDNVSYDLIAIVLDGSFIGRAYPETEWAS